MITTAACTGDWPRLIRGRLLQSIDMAKMGLVAIGGLPPIINPRHPTRCRYETPDPDDALIASGCADFAFNSNLDRENFDELLQAGACGSTSRAGSPTSTTSTSAPSRGILPERCQSGGAQCR